MHGAEIELKFPVTDERTFRSLVSELGFRLETERTFESNTLYDTPERRLRSSKQLLRLRQYGSRCTVTHKRQAAESDAGSRYKTRIETESVVEDTESLAEIFTQLGFAPVFRYEKYRTEWVAEGGGHLVLDETPIGLWAELEGEPAWIDSVLQKLGIAPESCSTASYGTLFTEWKAATGSPAEHLTFADTEALAAH
jgi:adenylate cyclase, class 2